MIDQKIWVIEPHADDAFLSLDWHIRKWAEARKVEIVTVFGSEKRAKEAAQYAEHAGASHRWLGYEEQGAMDGEVDVSIAWPEFLCDDIVIGPLGLRHDEHYAVRDQLDARLFSTLQNYLLYVDQPYAMQLKNQDELRVKSMGMSVNGIYKPGAKKFKKGVVDIFKTQSRFFYYNKDILPFTTEMILRPMQ